MTETASIESAPAPAEAREWILHVLSGPNLGAETRLADGIWVVGTGETADLTFVEPALAAAHLRIIIESDRIHLAADAPGTLIGGNELPLGSPTVLELLTPVSVGRTSFAIGPPGTDWSRVSTGGNYFAADTPMARAIPTAPPNVPKTQRRKWLVVALSGSLLTATVTVTCLRWWLMSHNVALNVNVQHPDALATAQDLIRANGLAPAVTAARAGGKVIISGPIQDGDDIDKLKEALRAAGIVADVNIPRSTVVPDSALVDMATTVMRAYGIEARVQLIGPGRIMVKGYAPSDEKIEQALDRLRQDVPSLSEIDDQIATPDRARAFLYDAMTADLRRDLTITPRPRSIVVAGTLNPTIDDMWQDVEDTFLKRFDQDIRLEKRISSTPLWTPRGVHLGPSPFIVLENGSRLKPGDNLEGSGKIVAIGRRGLWVRNAAGEIEIPYPARPKWMVEE